MRGLLLLLLLLSVNRKSVCICQLACQWVCPSVATLTVAFLDRFSPKLAQT